MRHIPLLIALCLTISLKANTTAHTADSLRTVLARTEDPKEQIRLYRNLADLTADTPEACGYLVRLSELSRSAGEVRPMMEALTDLASNYIVRENSDSAQYFIAQAEKYVPKGQSDQWCSYLRMRMFSAAMLGDEAGEAVEEKIAGFKNRDIAQESLYQQIEAEYILGAALYHKEQFEDALPYLLKSLQLAQRLPLREGKNYQLLIIRQLSRLYNLMKETQKGSELIHSAIKLSEKYYELYDKAERPFYPMDDFYITNYGSLLINILNLSDEEARFYLDRLVEMSDRSNNPYHKYSRFFAQFNYYGSKDDLQQALICNDSLIRYARQIAVYTLPNLYDINSRIYQRQGDYKKALANLRESSRLQDSIRMGETQVKLDKLRVEYDVNRLNFENSQLEIRNKRLLIVGLTIILLLAFILCIYLYVHLKQEQKTKRRMQELKMRAEESEKLKTAFINSICHEIRTPLNGIVGFAGLIFDTSIEEEERATFHKEVQQNTDQLISLVNSMLEVANLDISDEKLPCAPVDVCSLCCMLSARYAAANSASGVEGRTDCPGARMTIPTNERYLSLVIENLLDNAYKFTEQGHVCISCSQQEGHAVISVADTGCGIPAESRQIVFERFTKLDSYKQGSGLGLYLCKTIVRRLSGRIYIDPDYTAGTRIVVELPLG